MELKICVWNWADYNEGNANWKWFELPNEIDELDEYIEELQEQGREEFFICDTDGHSFIEEHTSLEAIKELSFKDEDELLQEYYENNPDSQLIDMSEIDDILSGSSVTEIANMIHFGSYNPNHDYFNFDGYGNIETVSEDDKEECERNFINEQAAEFIYSF